MALVKCQLLNPDWPLVGPENRLPFVDTHGERRRIVHSSGRNSGWRLRGIRQNTDGSTLPFAGRYRAIFGRRLASMTCDEAK
jgi:hypothetical protein